eukprot:jgi/Hompol1/3388/HPOL_003237-RA
MIVSDSLAFRSAAGAAFESKAVVSEQHPMWIQITAWMVEWALNTVEGVAEQWLVPFFINIRNTVYSSHIIAALDGDIEMEQFLLDVALNVMTANQGDIITFLNTVADETGRWIRAEIKYCEQALSRSSPSSASPFTRNKALILRAFISFVTLWGVALDPVELRLCFDLGLQIKNQQATKMLSCLLLLIAHQAMLTSKTEFKEVLQFVLNSNHSDFLLVAGIYFFIEQAKEVQKLLTSTVKMPCSIGVDNYVVIARLFRDEIFTQQKLAETAIALASKLGESHENLSISLTFHLLKARIFHNTGIDIQPSIVFMIHNYKRLSEDSSMDQLPSLLKLYCESCFEPSGTFGKLPIDPLFVQSCLKGDKASLPQQALVCFCVFYHRRIWSEKPITSAETYPDDFVDNLLLRPVLEFAEKNVTASSIYPQLVALIFDQCPEYYDPQIFISTQEFAQPLDPVDCKLHSMIVSRFGTATFETFDHVVLNPDIQLLRQIVLHVETEQENAVKILKVMMSKPELRLLGVLDIVLELLPALLGRNASNVLGYWFKHLWLKMLRYQPHFTSSQTIAKLEAVFRSRQAAPKLLRLHSDGPEETRWEVLTRLGKLFIDHPNLFPIFLHIFVTHVATLKLVHFQGYSMRLIPMVIEHIPSMHVVMDYLREMLAVPRLSADRFVFVVALAAQLFVKYPLERSFMIAKDIVLESVNAWSMPLMIPPVSNRESQASSEDIDNTIRGLAGAIGHLGVIVVAFPVLNDAMIKIITDINSKIATYGETTDAICELKAQVLRLLASTATTVLFKKTHNKSLI